MQIERTRGDTSPDVVTITTRKTRTATNISGCSFKLTVSRELEPVDATSQVFQMTGVITDAAKGIVEFEPTLEQADNVGYFYYDIEMVDTRGKVHTLVRGGYTFTQDITK